MDEAALRRLIEEQIAGGTDGIVPCGTTGESTTLSHEEHDRVIEITVEAVEKRVPVIAGTGSNSTAEAIRLTKHAWKAGADAALIVCPYYNRPTQEGLYLHYRAIAEEVPIPIIIYNIQGRTGVNMSTETLARLAEDSEHRRRQRGFRLPQADERRDPPVRARFYRPFRRRHLHPRLCWPSAERGSSPSSPTSFRQIWRRMVDAFAAGDLEKARGLHYRMSPLIDALFIETNPIPVKAALAMMGKIDYELRLPLCRMAEKNEAVLKKVMQEYGLIGVKGVGS